MKPLEQDNLIKEYYGKVKHLYPDVSEKEFEKICKNPFWFINKQMARDDMPTIHIKYFGKFLVLAPKIKSLMKETKDKLFFKRITQEEHDRRQEFLNNKLKQLKLHEQEQPIEIIEG